MNEALSLAPAMATGVLLGVMFFGGLWWTVRKVVSCEHPATWFLGSWLLRTAILLAGFYLLSDGRWDRLLTCLLGFIVARFFVTRFSGPPMQPVGTAEKG